MHHRSWPTLLGILALSLALTGCEHDEVQTYTVPRAGDDVGTGNTKLLVAIVPAGDDTWFFKLVGRADIVEMVEGSFHKLVDSLKFDGKALTWAVPEKWKEDRENPNRVATLRPEGVGRPEIAVTKLGGEQALKPNLDRWRRIDLGLGPITPRAMAKVARDKKVGGLKVTLVEMRGPGVEARASAPKMPPVAAKADPGGPIQYKTPEGWTEGGGNQFAAASFTVTKRGKSARVLVTPLGGAMPGGLLANVNRWRSEVELPPLSEAELKRADVRDVRVGNHAAKLMDLVGKVDRSLVVWLEADGKTWFFKMRGPRDVVDNEKDKFEAFIQSVSFR
ncbi:MAG: hypothetical protein U0797_13390 [Gemmataceae bacterium]